MNLVLKSCNIEDLEVLREISIETYSDTFGPVSTETNMKEYLDRAFDRNKLKKELMNDHSYFYFLYVGNEIAGYCKMNEEKAQTDVNDQDSIELERIYVSKNYQGCGCGRYLLEKAIEFTRDRGKQYIWLGVWEKNLKAIHFYNKNGFYQIGEHLFVMGDDEQTDYILRKDML